MAMQNRGGTSLRKVLKGMSREQRASFLLRMAKVFGEAMEPYRTKNTGEWRWRRKDGRDARKEQAKKETLADLRREAQGPGSHEDGDPPPGCAEGREDEVRPPQGPAGQAGGR